MFHLELVGDLGKTHLFTFYVHVSNNHNICYKALHAYLNVHVNLHL